MFECVTIIFSVQCSDILYLFVPSLEREKKSARVQNTQIGGYSEHTQVGTIIDMNPS